MMPFEYFLQKKDIRKIPPDKELAKSLTNDMKERIEKSLILDINNFSKFIFENIYDALRGFWDILLATKGFKSYSHQASISFLTKEDFDIPTIEELDKFRFKRNSSKYYGQIITPEDAKQIKEFYLKNKDKFNKIIKREKLE